MIEGGPDNKRPAGGRLASSIAPPGQGLASDRPPIASDPFNPNGSNTQIGTSYTGADACSLADTLKSTAEKCNQNPVPYLAVPWLPGTYNSNSFTHTLLNDVGLGNYFGGGVFGDYFFPGWTKRVPRLTP